MCVQLTVGPPSRHLVELLPGEGPLDAPGPHRPLLLDGVLEHRLQGHEHPQDVLGAEGAGVHGCGGVGDQSENTATGIRCKNQPKRRQDV